MYQAKGEWNTNNINFDKENSNSRSYQTIYLKKSNSNKNKNATFTFQNTCNLIQNTWNLNHFYFESFSNHAISIILTFNSILLGKNNNTKVHYHKRHNLLTPSFFYILLNHLANCTSNEITKK